MAGRTKKRKRHPFRRFKKSTTMKHLLLEWCELDLASRCILLIGVILLIELITSIFYYPEHSDVSITIVFRTGLSSVIGYILGGMNTPQETATTTTYKKPTLSTKDSSRENLSHFDDSTSCDPDQITLQRAKNIRACAAGAVCLICITTLFIAHSVNQLAYTEGLIQMRDLISTTIGYLISKSSRN